MIYSHEVEEMCTVNRGASHGCAPIPEEGNCWMLRYDSLCCYG